MQDNVTSYFTGAYGGDFVDLLLVPTYRGTEDAIRLVATYEYDGTVRFGSVLRLRLETFGKFDSGTRGHHP